MNDRQERSWSEAFAELSAAQETRSLDAEALERLAVAAYMVGLDDACESAWMRAHRDWLAAANAESGAMRALARAGLLFRGDVAPAMG